MSGALLRETSQGFGVITVCSSAFAFVQDG